MYKRSTLLAGLLFSCFQAFSQMLTGEEAAAVYPQADKVRLDEKTNALQYLRFLPGSAPAKTNFPKWLRETLRQPAATEWRQLEVFNDDLGYEHIRYQQYHHNLPVEGQIFIAHVKNGEVVSCNGESRQLPAAAPQAGLDARAAFHQALQLTGAKTYMWQDPQEEQLLKIMTNDSKATYYPNAQLVYAPVHGDFDADDYVAAYKLNIYSSEPLQRANVYLHATTGQLLFTENLLHDVDVMATAVTKYNGTRRIRTTLSNGQYRLESNDLGVGIRTMNVQRTTIYGSAIEFTDTDTLWNTTNAMKDEVALDAHWGAEVTYKYYKNKFNRNSYNNQGSGMWSFVHFDRNFNNAFWDGIRMTYGDGDGAAMSPLTSIDIVGHEFTHGVTGTSARLQYRNQSGALNESFSDIFGVAIDFANSGANANYLIGEAISMGGAFRNMQNPNQFANPDTYLGKYWEFSSADNGGVHTNSGVQNFWFYLLANGGQGVNDLNNAYRVHGIGLDKAERIAYRNLTAYLTSASNYADAAAMSVVAAEDLYTACSPEVVATADAWYAVGVGVPYRLAAAFISDNEFFCTAPATVQFTNKSNKATTYVWHFGDGQTSTATSPTHTYTTPGLYTVKLKANTGTAICGATTDSLVRTSFIRVETNKSVSAATCVPVPTSSPQAGMGIKKMTFHTITRESGDALEGHKDFTCNNQATLVAGNLYEMILETGSSPMQRARVWIDYNNDGAFDPIAEQAGNFNPFITSSTDIIRTKPNPVLNTPLRMRVAADLTANIDILPCETLMRGQYEDYGVTFIQQAAKPQVNFRASQTSVAANSPVNFFDLTNFQPTSWQWSFPLGTPSSSTQQNPTGISYPKDGLYSVTLIATNALGTDTMIKASYIRVGNGGITGVKAELNVEKNLQLFPNPAKDNVKIRYAFDGKKSLTIMLVNALGQEVMRKNASAANTFETELNLENLASGIYFLRFSDGTNLITRKLLVQKQ
jgi:Zn-dependent metalloprotease